MAAPLSVAAQARDLRININDSCNCCCFQWKKAASPNTPVYVNSRGVVQKFDPKIADDERAALKRSVSNLNKIIQEMAEARKKDKEEVMTEIHYRIAELREDAPQVITVDMVRQMIDIVNQPKGKK